MSVLTYYFITEYPFPCVSYNSYILVSVLSQRRKKDPQLTMSPVKHSTERSSKLLSKQTLQVMCTAHDLK